MSGLSSVVSPFWFCGPGAVFCSVALLVLCESISSGRRASPQGLSRLADGKSMAMFLMVLIWLYDGCNMFSIGFKYGIHMFLCALTIDFNMAV